jgi:two-component system CheB/CheR fusion protein
MQRPSNKTTGVGRPKRVAAARRRPGDAAVDFPVVAIGASAGGLEACSLLLDAMRDAGDTAFILVLHLDPTHESLMVDLLAAHTSLTVLQAKDGMPVQRGHFYIIPPAYFLAMGGGVLHLTPSPANQGARLPFDFLLQSMSRECGGAAICVVLSGTGADGSVGLLAVKREGGFVIAQEPSEADRDRCRGYRAQAGRYSQRYHPAAAHPPRGKGAHGSGAGPIARNHRNATGPDGP